MSRLIVVATLVVALAALVAPLPATAQGYGVLIVRFIDVGAGDATLIDAPNGQQVLIDCGPATSATRLVAQLQAAGVDHVDVLAPSSKRPEDIGGCAEILRRFPVTRLATTNQSADSTGTWKTFSSFAGTMADSQLLQIGPILDPAFLPQLGAAKATLLNPRVDGEQLDDFDGSQVLLIDYLGTRILLMGALHRTGEVQLPVQDPITILKIGDHGSIDTADPKFLAWARPTYAVVSYANGRGFPQPDADTLARLGQYTGAGNIYGTPQSGTITVTVQPDGSRTINGER
jgi:competence protein ComEC